MRVELRPLLCFCLALSLAISLAEPAFGGRRQAKRLHAQGEEAELRHDYDRALELYEQAWNEDPENHRYELTVRRMRFVAGQMHVDRGRRLRERGDLENALAEFERAIRIDPASPVAAQQRQRTIEMIEERNKALEQGEEAPPPATSAIDRERQRRREQISRLKGIPDLEPMSQQPIDINIPSEQDASVVFETIAGLAGINVLFDPDFQDQKVSLEIKNATLSEALDYVSLLAKTYWKPISHNAVFITNDNTNKRREYEEEVVKTFYLTNVSTPQELQEVATAIRGLTDIRRMFAVNSMNALVIRGTEAKIALAEKVINDVDKPKSEVIIDVLVLETSRTRNRRYGITPISGGTPGLDLPVTFAPGGSTPSGENGEGGAASGGGVRLSNLGGLSGDDWVTTLPGAQLTALLSRSDTRLLQSPRIRVADNMQASLRIGDRIPIATGSFQPGVGGVGINPLVNTQFNYTDVGVNVDLQPKIHSDREVSMHIEIEISNVRDFVDIGGISQPVIGQRLVNHDIRIEEGEASVLGGLNQSQIFTTRSGVPFLSEIPIIGRVFSSNDVQVSENEILIVLIPHLVRLPEISRVNLQGVASGSDQVFQVRYAEEPNDKPALPPVGAKAPAADEEKERRQAEARPAPEEPERRPSEAQPAPPEPAPEPAPPAPPEQPAPADQSAAPALRFEPAEPAVGVGERTEVNLLIDNANQIFGAPLRLFFDQKIFRIVEIAQGPFLRGPDGTDLIFSRNIRSEVGQAAVNISRFPGTGGADGSGVLLTITIEGVAPGSAPFRATPTGARTADARPVAIAAASVNVSVR